MMVCNITNKKMKEVLSLLMFFVVTFSHWLSFASSVSNEKNIENIKQSTEQSKTSARQKSRQSDSKNNPLKQASDQSLDRAADGSKNYKQQEKQQHNEENCNGRNNASLHNQFHDQKDSATKSLVSITDAYARVSIPGSKNSALYMKIKNLAEKNLTIIDVQAKEVANKTELHTTVKDQGTEVLRMEKVDNVVITPNETKEFKPGGDHVMLLDLKKELKENDDFDASVSFKEIEPVNFSVKVKKQ